MMHPLEKFKYCPVCGSSHWVEHNFKSKACTDCGFVYYANPSAATAAIILNTRNEMLVVRRGKEPAKGTLDLVGGFVDMCETIEEGMRREIKEETGLDVQFLGNFRAADEHALLRESRPDVTKQITYFLAEYKGQSFRPQPGEISQIRLMTFEEALDAFQYESSKRILWEAAAYLSAHGT